MQNPAEAAKAAQGGAQRQQDGGGHSGHESPKGGAPLKTGPGQAASSGRPPDSTEPDSGKKSKRRRRRRKAKKPYANPPTLPPVKADKPQPNPARPDVDKIADAPKMRGGDAPRPKPSSQQPPNPPAQPTRRGDLYAALDLGTNNCRLLIAAPTRPGQFRVVDAFSRIVRLGEGLTSTGRLSDAAMNRAIEALKICADKLRNRVIRRQRLIATEACRAAANGEEFLARVKAETGLDLEIVDRETEARLAVTGCGPLVTHSTDALVLFDIGGGSSEVALIDRSKRRSPRLSDQIIAWTSLPVGVVSLAERFGGKHVTGEVYGAMVADVLAMIERFEDKGALGDLAKGDRFHLFGTSGTVTTLAGIHLGLERYDRRRVDGLWMDDADVDAMSVKLRSWTFEERVANACIGAERADLVLAGCAILDGIRQTWPAPRMRVADRGLREGLLTEMMAMDGAWRRRFHGGGR